MLQIWWRSFRSSFGSQRRRQPGSSKSGSHWHNRNQMERNNPTHIDSAHIHSEKPTCTLACPTYEIYTKKRMAHEKPQKQWALPNLLVFCYLLRRGCCLYQNSVTKFSRSKFHCSFLRQMIDSLVQKQRVEK